RVHALEDQEQRPAVLGVEFFLKIVQPLAIGVEDLFALVLVESALLVGLVRLEMKLLRPVDAERLDKWVELTGKRWRGRFLAHVSCASRNAVTWRGIAGVISVASRTRWMALSSGALWQARLASIFARSASPDTAACRVRIIATKHPVTTQSQCPAAR